MKARRQEAVDLRYSKACPAASRSSSLRNELLHSLRNNQKLQQHQQAIESAPVSPSYHIPINTSQIAQLELPPAQMNNNSLIYSPPSRPPSPTSHHHHQSLHHSISNESNRSHNTQHFIQPPPHQQFELSKLPTPRLALLTGSRKLISRLGQLPSLDSLDAEFEATPECYLLKTPATEKELRLASAEGMNGHILVCMHHKVSNIFKFIYNLR
jgi:hypothetical protein